MPRLSELIGQCLIFFIHLCSDEGSSKGNKSQPQPPNSNSPQKDPNSHEITIPSVPDFNQNKGHQCLDLQLETCSFRDTLNNQPIHQEIELSLPQSLEKMTSDNNMGNSQQPLQPEVKVSRSTETDQIIQKNSSTTVENFISSPENQSPTASQDISENPLQLLLLESSSEIQNNLPKHESSELILSSLKTIKPFELNQRGLKNPGANECFANALLQVLYNLSEFRDLVQKQDSKLPENEIQKKLCQLFEVMENKATSLDEIQRNKKELFIALENKNSEIVIFRPNGGDSRTLFQVLASGICEEKSFNENHIFSLFSTGNLEKVVECPSCRDKGNETKKRFSEKLLMLSAQENLFYDQQEPNNFFQTEFEMRTCRVCSQRIQHIKKITLQTLPKVLAIKIEESSANPTAFQERKPHKCLTFSDNQGIKVNYKFFGGVYNTQRGFDGFHSIAYVMESEDNNSVMYYNDSMARTTSWGSVYGYPKLLFYCQEE